MKQNSKTFLEQLIDAYVNNQFETLHSKNYRCFTAISFNESEQKLIQDTHLMKPIYINYFEK